MERRKRRRVDNGREQEEGSDCFFQLNFFFFGIHMHIL